MEAAEASGVRCVKVRVDEEEEGEEEEVVEDRGRVVAGQYELVRTVFSYLPWRDLETCAKVGIKIDGGFNANDLLM